MWRFVESQSIAGIYVGRKKKSARVGLKKRISTIDRKPVWRFPTTTTAMPYSPRMGCFRCYSNQHKHEDEGRKNYDTNNNNMNVNHMNMSPQQSSAQSISQISSQLTNLQHRIDASGCDSNATVWNCDLSRRALSTDSEISTRIELIANLSAVSSHLHYCVFESNLLQPSGRHRHEFSVIIERLIGFCAQLSTPETDLYTIYVIQFLDMMRHFQLELNHHQCDLAVTVAAQEGLWKEAASLYTSHIDPDESGYTPATTTSMTETITGLYCIARAAKEAGDLPVEKVFEGVLNLTLVSGLDSESFVLAAGIALGYAGEWEGLKEYMKTSYRANELGQPLVAATMHACILSNRHDEALALFDDLVGRESAAIASEWQWGGGIDQLHTACRDLAIRALGGVSATGMVESNTMTRERAFRLFAESLEQDARVSIDALCALASTCEPNGDWEVLMDVFLRLMDKAPDTWLALGNEVHLTVEKSKPELKAEDLVTGLGVFLNRVMQVCNTSKKFGLSLLCLELFSTLSGAEPTLPIEVESTFARVVLSKIGQLPNANDLVVTTMVALCGLKAPQKAIDLNDAFRTLSNHVKENDQFAVSKYAEHLKNTSSADCSFDWEVVQRSIHRLIACIQSIQDQNEILSVEDARMLSAVLACSVRDCVVANQPEAGIVLGKWIEQRSLQFSSVDSVILFSQNDEDFRMALPMTDALLSSAMEGFGASGNANVAVGLAQSHLGDERSPTSWLLSYHEAVKILFAQGQPEDALSLFKRVLKCGRSPALFCSVAKNLKLLGDQQAILDIYRLALSSGCMSEELSFLAMESASASASAGQHLSLNRSIIDETANWVGVTQNAWKAKNYWKLKKSLGFSTARLLLDWDDYKTSRLDELELALEQMDERLAAQLTPNEEVLSCIVSSVPKFDALKVPFNKTKISKVPRDEKNWIELLDRVLYEAKATGLLYDAKFIEDAAIAFERLGRHEDCVKTVNAAIARGLRPRKLVLERAKISVEAEGLDAFATDIDLLLVDYPR